MGCGLHKRVEDKNMADARLLEHRKMIKDKKPTFLRQDANRNKSLENKWRKPKGMHSKMRLRLRGRRASPSPGYASPRAVKGLTRAGLKEIYVQTVKDMEGFDSKIQIIVIGKVGTRKRAELVKLCVERKYPIAQIKDTQAYLQKVETNLVARKNKKKQKVEKTKTKEEILKKTKATKEDNKEETAPSEVKEETKKGDKSDKIKVLEKKQ